MGPKAVYVGNYSGREKLLTVDFIMKSWGQGIRPAANLCHVRNHHFANLYTNSRAWPCAQAPSAVLVVKCLEAAAAKHTRDCKCGTVKERRALVLCIYCKKEPGSHHRREPSIGQSRNRVLATAEKIKQMGRMQTERSPSILAPPSFHFQSPATAPQVHPIQAAQLNRSTSSNSIPYSNSCSPRASTCLLPSS